MSFLREVVGIANENEVVDARKNINKVLEEIKNFQYKIKAYIDDNYTEFMPNLNNNQLYLDESERLLSEMDHLVGNIANDMKNDLLNASLSLQEYLEELDEVGLGLKTSNKLLKIHDLFQLIERAAKNHEYRIVMGHIGEIKQLVYDPNDAVLRNLDCYENIKIKYHIEHEQLLHNLKLGFESLVQLQEKQFQKTKSVIVRISRDENLLHETIVALINSKYNPRHVCDFLLNNVFGPIITNPVSLECSDDDAQFVSLTLSYGLRPLADDLRPNYKVVFANLMAAFRCLGHMNISISDGCCVFGIFADHIKEQFLRQLIDNCLAHSIPNTMDEMNDSTMVADLLEFDRFLGDMLFLSDTKDLELRNFAEKIGILFKNRFCMNIVDSAVEIMQKDLHDMILIAEVDGVAKQSASDSVVAFPRCMVSKSTLELITLMEKVFRQVTTTTAELVQRLLSTIPIILERYLTEVPKHHAKLLINIPQQTALFHNNCMYLAHWLNENTSKGIESAATIVKSLHHCGSEQFLRQITNQRGQLMEILKDFDIGKGASELDLQSAKVIRQCLRQLELLKNVWQTILPQVVYNKTMANILNDFCSEIIRRILVIEDIPSPVSSGLVKILDNIITRAPSIFQDELQVSVIVKSWTKLTQLKMILNASMAHITEQWSEGLGPLTLHYKSDEIKHLIRALFQNTDRRANALAKIV